MPAAEDGEWSNWCSNVVCVRTKSSKEPENSSDGQVIHVQPIVVRSTYREEPRLSAPLPRAVPQRRRITRLIQSSPLSSTSPIQYEGVGRVSLSLKAPSVSSSTYNGPSFVEYSRPPLLFPPPPPKRSPVRIVLKKPVEYHHLIPDISSSSLLSGRDLRPSYSDLRPSYSDLRPSYSDLRPSYSNLRPSYSDLRPSYSNLRPSYSDLRPSYSDLRPSYTLPSSSLRASSLPPLRRSSVAVPGYSVATSGFGGRPIVANTGSVTSSLRRGSVDVSYLSSVPDFLKSPSYLRHTAPPVPSEVGLRSNYRRGSLSIPRPTFRSSSVGRLLEDELKTSLPLSSAPETLSSLRTRTQKAKDKLDTQRSLLDRYLPGGSREPSIDTRFDLRDGSVSRRSSVSTLPRPLSGSRAPSLDRSNDLGSAAAVHRTPPPPSTPNMSPARRRIRNVLFKVSGDEEFLN